MGVSGRSIVEVMVRGARCVVCFVVVRCHFVLVLFAAGSIVREVA